MDISTDDFNLYKKKLATWQENYIAKLLKEYSALLNDETKNPSERFWTLEEKLEKDKTYPGVIVKVARSKVEDTILTLLNDHIIKMDDLEEFSQEFKDYIKIAKDR